MKTIPLTQGKVAIVDDEDYDELMKYKWSAKHRGQLWYARRTSPSESGRRRTIYMHRVLIAGDSRLEVDHINGDGLDNRRANLRLVTPSGNQRNQKKHRAGGLLGTSYQPHNNKTNPWRATIWLEGHLESIGCYATAQAAHEAVRLANAAHELIKRM